jgi:hypothetical protein
LLLAAEHSLNEINPRCFGPAGVSIRTLKDLRGRGHYVPPTGRLFKFFPFKKHLLIHQPYFYFSRKSCKGTKLLLRGRMDFDLAQMPGISQLGESKGIYAWRQMFASRGEKMGSTAAHATDSNFLILTIGHFGMWRLYLIESTLLSNQWPIPFPTISASNLEIFPPFSL